MIENTAFNFNLKKKQYPINFSSNNKFVIKIKTMIEITILYYNKKSLLNIRYKLLY